jgi:hypothetical protein
MVVGGINHGGKRETLFYPKKKMRDVKLELFLVIIVIFYYFVSIILPAPLCRRVNIREIDNELLTTSYLKFTTQKKKHTHILER